MEEHEHIRSIGALLHEKLRFYVPFYQRGYRWTDEEIKQLLDDVLNWKSEQGYFLQLLVVCWNEDESRFNIVDGQQRLTTISLILDNLEMTGFDIKYARGTDQGGADARFRKNATTAINAWLQNKDGYERKRLLETICEAEFLYYKVERPDEEMAMFQQLNTWRIPATDAELVKCVVLSKGTSEILSRRAYEWDMVEQSLQDDSFCGMLKIIEDDHHSRMEAFLHNLYDSPYR